jgi:TPR repeat protein
MPKLFFPFLIACLLTPALAFAAQAPGKSAAAQSNTQAPANELAVIYLQGLFGQKENPLKARELFARSAEAGNLEGIKNFAVLLKDGIGQKPDPEAALRWYLIAQKGGLAAKDLDEVMDGLKKGLNDAQIKKAERDAEQWMSAYAKRK